MKPKISFESQEMWICELGEETSVPDLVGGLVLQNGLKFDLEEDDEIFEGYGTRKNAYPYRQRQCYSETPQKRRMETAVLENDYLKAVFLPGLGGRLWSLTDKTCGKNLLYTNDVIQYRNLAVRNAWFSGGVEWNIGVIGHTPFTTEQLFTATLEQESGCPVLRMYEYERIRQVTYQMDFWLEEDDRFLNCRMRIVNTGTEVVPMYWWSNMAVPEHKQGRVIVPAKKAFTYRDGGVYKVEIPVVEGVDISKYAGIPGSTDYFFEIPKEEPKYIAHVDEHGYGLLHLSTSRLQSRKLFSWGNRQGGDHWQEYLTKDAGRYLEIQAGLGKTQYGCLPMAPHTAWEWLERYGAVQLEEEDAAMEFEPLRDKVTETVVQSPVYLEMEDVLKGTKPLAWQSARVKMAGSGFGALKNRERAVLGERAISENLDFGDCTGPLKVWAEFLEQGHLPEPDVNDRPDVFLSDEAFFGRLKEAAEGDGRGNWYVHYHLGLYYFMKEHDKQAEKAFLRSLECAQNSWAYHGLASTYYVQNRGQESMEAVSRGILMRPDDLSYLKDGFKLLSMAGGWQELLNLYETLDQNLQADGRLTFYRAMALYETGSTEEAYRLLFKDGGMSLPDIREGERAIGELWLEIHKKMTGECGEVPYRFDFIAT